MISIYNVFICVILLSLLLWKVKIAKTGTFIEPGFSLEACKSIQGFFGLLIIIHHMYIFLSNKGYSVEQLKWSANIGVYLIGFFFFCSGYGLVTSIHTKENYLDGFLVKRVLIVLVPFFICNYAYMFVEQLLGNKYSMLQLICAFFGIVLLNTQMWFAVEIMLLYLVFYFLFKYIKKEAIAILIITAIVIVETAICIFCLKTEVSNNWFHGEWWYNTLPLFVAGMIVANKKEWFKKITIKYYYFLLIFSLAGCLITGKYTAEILENYGYWTLSSTDKLITYSIQVPHIIFFEMLVILIMQKVKFRNLLLDLLGRFALEILLVSGVFLDGFSFIINRYGIVCYFGVTFAGTMVSAILLYKLKRFILEIR